MFALIHVHYEYLKSQISTNHIHKQTFITKESLIVMILKINMCLIIIILGHK